MAWLQRQVESFIRKQEGEGGRCMQAFCYAVTEEFKEFLKLIAHLEAVKDERGLTLWEL